MPFYKLEHSTSIPEIGLYPQAQLEMSRKVYDEKALFHLDIPSEGRIQPFSPARFILEKGAKMIDYLAIVPKGGDLKMLSPRLYELLQLFQIDEFQSFPTELVNKGSHYPYHLIHLVCFRNRDYIDWEQTVFGHTTNMWRELIAELQFQDYDAFTSFRRAAFSNNEHLIVRKLVLREDVIDKDLFRLLFVSTGFYVSQRLKDALQAENISGCKFTPLADLGELVLRERNHHMFNDNK